MSARFGRALARCAAVTAAAIVLLGIAAPAAGAHSTAGLPSTDWRSRVVAVRVGTKVDAALQARISDLGQHVELTTDPSLDVVVLGYRGEPYLWFTHGRVLENTRSPAVWENRRKDFSSAVPTSYNAHAIPAWQTIAGGTTYRWHDQRVHATSHDTRSYNWTVPLRVNGHDGAIAGRLDLVPGPPLAIPLLAIAAGTVAIVFVARRRPSLMAVIALVIAVLGAAQLVGTWQATTATLWQRLGPSLYAVGAIVSAVAIAAAARSRTRDRYPEALLVGGIVLAITGGLAHVDWLTHSQLPTTWNPGVARAMLVAQLAVGAGATIAAVMLLEARVSAAARPKVLGTFEPGGIEA